MFYHGRFIFDNNQLYVSMRELQLDCRHNWDSLFYRFLEQVEFWIFRRGQDKDKKFFSGNFHFSLKTNTTTLSRHVRACGQPLLLWEVFGKQIAYIIILYKSKKQLKAHYKSFKTPKMIHVHLIIDTVVFEGINLIFSNQIKYECTEPKKSSSLEEHVPTSYLSHPEGQYFSPDQWNLVADQEF